MIRVQQAAFNVAEELNRLKADRVDVGASVIFLGTVRDMSGGQGVSALTLEHYPGMTEKALAEIEAEAHARWPLLTTTIIHRYGKLEPGDDIVLIITTSAHREAAFEACHFLIDWLKTTAPFWKLEADGETEKWVDARCHDQDQARRWLSPARAQT